MKTKKIDEGMAFIRLILVWSSLSPVFLLWAIRGVPAICDRIWIPICLVLFLLPTLILLLVAWLARRAQNVKTITVSSSKDQREHLLTYLFAMLIPLFDANLDGIRSVFAMGTAFLFIMFLFWHMRLHYMNLIFAIFDYRIFTVEARSGPAAAGGNGQRMKTFAVISRRHHLPDGEALTGYRLGGNVLVDTASND